MWGDVQEMSYICPMQKCQNYFDRCLSIPNRKLISRP